MRIAIITLPLHTNYGGILQAYALQRVLSLLGHNAVVIDKPYSAGLPIKTKYLVYIKRAFLRYIKGKDIEVFPDITLKKLEQIKRQHTNQFINKHIKRLLVKDVTQIKNTDFDCFVVGSDQIWRCIYNRYFPGTRNAFLEFAKEWDVKRIAYAASFGTDEWEYSQEDTIECAKLAKLFDTISVREISAIDVCKEKFGVEATHLLDPTMLVPTKEYIKLFQEAGIPKSNGNLMCYILDRNDETSQIINEIATHKSLTPFYTNSKAEDPNAPISERIQPPVEEWLRSFHDAEFIITDSFHACVFSILFKKPFIVYGNNERGMARFISLLHTFDLTERLITNKKNIDKIIDKKIDWENVEKLLIRYRKEAINFLSTNLNSNAYIKISTTYNN